MNIKDNQGAIVVEAVYVIPIVVIVIYVLIYMALMQIQKQIIYNETQKISQKLVKNISFPGYEHLALLSEEDLNNCDYNKIFSIHNPYRHLFNHNKIYGSYADLLKTKINNTKIIMIDLDKPQINIVNRGLSKQLNLSINYYYKMPCFVKILGINNLAKGNVVIRSCAIDSSEFIRNVDISFDLIDFLLQRLGLKDKIELFYDKINNLKSKMNIK